MVRRRPALSAILGAAMGILILASGCADRNPTATQLGPARALSASKSYDGGSYSAVIGPEGGTITFPIGQIVFPAGAVSTATRIQASLDGKTIAVGFKPHMTFSAGSQPVLTLSFKGTGIDPARLVVFHVSDDGHLEETLRPLVDPFGEQASVEVPGFSLLLLAVS